MSFFDEADEEPQQPPRIQTQRQRRPPRTSGRGGGRRPPRNDRQAVQTRRLVLAGVIVAVVILMAVLIHGCEAGQTKNSLKNYSNAVSQLITSSDSNGQQMWKALAGAKGSTLENDLDREAQTARTQLAKAEGLSVPSQMSKAQQNFLLVMTERADGIDRIARNIHMATTTATAKDGVAEIISGTSLLYSSDVVYKNYTTVEIAQALHGDGITVCAPGTGSSCAAGGVSINAGQLVHDLGWLQQSFVAAKLGAKLPTKDLNGDQPGLHGDNINASSTTVDGVALSTTGTTSITQSGPPKFKLSVTDGGNFKQDPTCKVSVDGISATATTGALAAKGGSGTCTVTLPKKVPAGTYTVTATVEKVPRETNTENNTATYYVTFS